MKNFEEAKLDLIDLEDDVIVTSVASDEQNINEDPLVNCDLEDE